MANPVRNPAARAAALEAVAAAAAALQAAPRPVSPVLDLFPGVRPAPLPTVPPAATVPPPWSGRF